jgi:hypothetical protein
MEEIIKGLNREKEILVSQMVGMKDYHYNATQEKVKVLNARLTIVDDKLDGIAAILIKDPECRHQSTMDT